jgi:hypothetical protein
MGTKANPLAINAIKRSFFMYFPFWFVVVLRGMETPATYSLDALEYTSPSK